MRFVFYMFIFISFLFSCGLETAKPGKNTEVVIASNFLFPRDVRFYKGFQKRTGIHVKIIHLSSDSINKHLQKYGYNSEFDLLFVSSLQDIKNIKTNYIHKFKYNVAKNKYKLFKPIVQNHWLVAGIDPFVFSFIPDSTQRPDNYKALTQNYLWATPDEDQFQLSVFLSHVSYHLRNNKKHDYRDWVNNMQRNKVEYDKGTDSTASQQFLLIKYSFLKTDSLLSKDKAREYLIPNKNKNGFYADRFCISVVEQTRNFANAKQLLKYVNQYGKIPAPFEIFPIHSNKVTGLNKLSEETILKHL